MQNGTYPWMASSSLTQKSWPPGYQASLTDLFLKKNPLHFSTGISQLAAASSYIEKMSTMNEPPPKCPHPDAKDKPYPCEICQQYLTLCNTLRTECTTANNNVVRMTNSPIMTNSPSENKPMNLMPNSSNINNNAPTPIQSVVHQSQNPVPVPMPNMSMGKPRPLPTKQFPCPVCHKFFTQKGNLKTHMMIHTGEKPYSCHACGKCFTQKGNVDTHMKIHTGEREFGCDACGKRFTQKGNLKTHIRSVHTKEKPFACGLCGKCFSQKGNMQTHLRTHNKDDRFPCTLCGKTFSQKGNLKTHMQRHAGQIPTKRQFGSRLANRTFTSQLMKPVHPSVSHMPPFPMQSSPVPSQASTTSPLNSPTTPQPLTIPSQNNRHHELRSPRHGLGNSYSDSPIDLKPPISCHLPTLSRPLSCNQNQGRNNSPSPHQSQLSSPSPEEEEHSPRFLPSKLFQNANNLQNSHQLSEPMSQMHLHNNLMSNQNQSRITSPLPIPAGQMSNHDHDPRPFYSAPPTPIPGPMPPVSRWLPHAPARHYDSFQTHGGLSCYSPMAPTTTPLSRLSLLACGTMNSHHNSIENHDDEPPKENNHDLEQQPPRPPPPQQQQQQQQQQQPQQPQQQQQPHPQEHFHSPANPDFSQLLD